MYWAISTMLLVLWGLGMVTARMTGPWLHLFLVFALVSASLAVMSTGRRARLAPARARAPSRERDFS